MNGSSRRRPATEPPRDTWSTLFAGRAAGWGTVGVVVAAGVLGLIAWSQLGEWVRTDPGYVLLPEGVEVRGVAPWVKSDVKGEALRQASLDGGLPLDDPELPRRLGRAFDMHPWVRQVVRVKLAHPAAAVVEIQCREPVAMVGVKGGLLAIDAEGVVLPSGDFTAESAAHYPRIKGIDSSPQGPEGSAWGDPVVEEAAALAVAIGPEWNTLDVVECRPKMVDGRRTWELVREGGGTILFGSAPGREVGDEPLAAGKVARLRALSGGGGTDDREIDLSKPAEEPVVKPVSEHEPAHGLKLFVLGGAAPFEENRLARREDRARVFHAAQADGVVEWMP